MLFDGEASPRKEQPMGNIVMTLLVRRQPPENTEFPFAVQITFPKEMCPGEMSSFTSVRLIHKNGIRSTASETIDSYHPQEWRAADPSEQTQYTVHFNGNPRPWYCVIGSLYKSVYDYTGSGEEETNNGQMWTGIEDLDREWKTGWKAQKKCEEELDAEWSMRLADELRTIDRKLEQDNSMLQWEWRQIGPP
jgi:hypothetical protein